VEALLAELLAALGAEEVLGVPGFLQGGHTFLKEKISSHLRANMRWNKFTDNKSSDNG